MTGEVSRKIDSPPRDRVPLSLHREAAEVRESEVQLHRMRLEDEFQDYCRDRVKRLISGYSPERLELALQEQLKVVKREQPEWFSRVPDVTRRELAMSRLQTVVSAEADIPSFDAWRKRHPEQCLF